MYPRYWMKFCFEITTKSGVRSVSAGPVRSWSFFFPLSMLNTWPFLQRGPRFSAHWDVVLFAKWCKWISPHHACKMPFSDALSGNTTDDWWGNTVAWPGLSFNMNLCVNWELGGVVPEREKHKAVSVEAVGKVCVPFSFSPVWKRQWLNFKIY